jgi:class 3 adenylate cyclase
VEVDTQGDAFLVAFAAADAALVAAVDIQRTHAPHVWPSDAVLRVRIGLNEVRSCHVRADTLITTACGIGIRNLATAEWASLVGRQTAYAPSCP